MLQLKGGLSNLKKQRWIEALKKSKAGIKDDAQSNDESGLLPTSVWAWNAFITLNSQRWSTERGHPLPISIAEIEAYTRLYDLSRPEACTLCDWMTELDRIYLEHRFAQIEQEAKRQARKAKSRQGRAR